MKHIQGVFLTGYITIAIKGEHPEEFLQACSEKGIIFWQVRKIAMDTYQANMRLQDLKHLRKIKRKGQHITFTHKKGLPFAVKRFLARKAMMIALILSLSLIVFLSNIIWKVEVTGVPKEIEEKIYKQLTSYGVHRGVWSFSLDGAGKIQQQLIEDIPELLWVGVHKKGTTFYLEGIEKVLVEEEKVTGPRDLVATKKGVIQRIYVSKGIPMVERNELVQKGDLLVAGNLTKTEQQEEKKEQTSQLVSATGEIIATTWYEVETTVPLEASYELLTGKHKNKFYFGTKQLVLPIWGFKDPDFVAYDVDRDIHDIYFLKWKLPFQFIKSTWNEKTIFQDTRTREEALAAGKLQAKEQLQLQLGPKAKIVSEKLLHETVEHGKVKMNLYFTVEENIATAKAIDARSE